MKTTVAIWLLAGALLASAALNVRHARTAAHQSKPCPSGKADPCADTESECRLSEQLGLTKGQRERLFDCCGGVCTQRRGDLDDRIETLVTELRDALNADPLDRKRVNQLANQIAGLRTEQWEERIECVLNVRETLTPSQLEQLAATVAGP